MAVTVRFARSITSTRSPVNSLIPLASYQSRPFRTICSKVFSPASTGESMMRL